MGIIRSEERAKAELDEFRRMLMASAGAHRRKSQHDHRFNGAVDETDDGDQGGLVCVTSGLSFLGIAIVNCLLIRGYSVRIIVDNPDLEKIEEMESNYNNGNNNSNNISAIMANLADEESLLPEVFKDCRGVFHTSAFIDPAGLSGYTKYMADIEAKASENVIKACARTPSVKKFVLTSSLLTCLWRDSTRQQENSLLINHDSWSSESLCRDKKLWYALGKLRAEKATWIVAEESGLNMASICPGLITGPEFYNINSTATTAYLKGAQEMYKNGLLASVDVNRLAEAHVCVYEAMNKTTGGRYICFDEIINDEEGAEKLAKEINVPKSKFCGTERGTSNAPTQFQLSKKKLTNLMSTQQRPCYNQSQEQL
ncbi:cinnamoyl-CoA reductase-like SNL6 isoform X2 [Humulus lupulus]|uniref:cinnamoyl-CoA reductase-like SNL6 isoform X2 n=1 Tax=Humulus lupulus TaxID=3486 RepID=UPI002B413F1A|nr:cinnamoyl-CoA reductase-like SNL6 isoform X2 [Humulus lupulus]